MVTALLAVLLACSLLHAVEREWVTQKRAGFVRVVIAEPEAPVEGGLISAADVEYLGYYEFTDNSQGYGRGFTIRRVGDETRFIHHAWLAPYNYGNFKEYSFNGVAYGGTISSANKTKEWTPGSGFSTRNDNHENFWWDHDGDRLWFTQSVDYPWTPGLVFPGNIQILNLDRASSSGTNIYKITLENIRDRRHHGGAVKVPASFQTRHSFPPYIVGFGGYTSLLTDNGGCSMGLAAYAMPDPAAYKDSAPVGYVDPQDPGAIIPTSDYVAVAQRGSSDRGVRRYYDVVFTLNGGTQMGQPTGTFAAVQGEPTWGPLNYLDGGDYRGENPGSELNPQNYPSAMPVTGSAPYYNHTGRIAYNTQNWTSGSDVTTWKWMDQYVGGFFLDGPNRYGFCQVASVQTRRVFYHSSAITPEAGIAELHVFDAEHLAEVKAGTRTKWQVQPKVIIPLVETADATGILYFHRHAAGFDPVTNRLYILANRGESGPSAPRAFRIFVYQINNL